MEQQRVRGLGGLRKVRAVGAVNSGKKGIAAGGFGPTLGNGGQRKAHAIGGLMAGDAGAVIFPERLEEGMAGGMNRAELIQDTDLAVVVSICLRSLQQSVMPAVPPGAPDAVGSGSLRGEDGREDRGNRQP